MKTNECSKDMSFNECELTILRSAVDKAEKKIGRKIVNSPDVKKMISIVEKFIRRKKLICYGGTAINAILPKADQFYDKDTEIADYDFFSTNALEDAKELADLYVENGFEEVEAKSGQHHGTYKVFVNFIGMADITQVHKDIFKALKSEAMCVNGILYASPNYLRMAMFLELSRPAGDVSRWEKVLKRLSLLNKHHPLLPKNIDIKCPDMFQRNQEKNKLTNTEEAGIYETLKDTFINEGVVFFGGYAMSIYSRYMPKLKRNQINKIPDFDVLSEEPEETATIIKEQLISQNNISASDIKIKKHSAIGEIVAPHYEVIINKNNTIAFIYKPLACHSYNIIKENGQIIKIATIDTMLSFYLAFLYSGRKYYNNERILCLSDYMFRLQEKNKLRQHGVLKRFSLNCYGEQQTIESMRAEKTKMFEQLKNDRNSQEYQEWFLRYRPLEHKKMPKQTSKKHIKHTKHNKNTKKHTKKQKKTYQTKKNRFAHLY